MILKKIEENTCPYCGEDENIESSDSGIEDRSYYYSMECRTCGRSWTEWYDMHFAEVLLDDGRTLVQAGKEEFEYNYGEK